uniref:LRRC8 pannexin-like TM region domain-containing protein n=1 Tax=Sander lucioperca TaxID=283035 RepID=A0A8C9ZXJ7_SANLU
MFSLSELAPLNQHQSRSKLLKPWWEVFMDYLVVLMLMASVLACTEQLCICYLNDVGAGRETDNCVGLKLAKTVASGFVLRLLSNIHILKI